MDYSWIGMTRAHMSDETMMRNNNLLKWSSKHHKSPTGSSPWIHPPGALQGAHVAYLVKFLGCTEVEQAKGIEVVKAGIQKMRFNSHVKRSEGSKIAKVELTISIDGVAIQEPKTKRILYQYPLYRISYCADDKAEKRFFCFIAKEENSTDHRCFVFVSDRLAENITLTIGQAFDLAYRRFLETSGRELEMRKQILVLQKRAKLLERENIDLKSRITELETLNPSEAKTERATTNNVDYFHLLGHSDSSEKIAQVNGNGFGPTGQTHAVNGTGTKNIGNGYSSSEMVNGNDSAFHKLQPPPVPPRPRTSEEISAPGAPSDLITLDPFASVMTPEEDPFGDFHKLFTSTAQTNKQFDDAIGRVDRRINEMQEGFSRGLLFGKDDFCLDAFDPLSKKSTTSSHA